MTMLWLRSREGRWKEALLAVILVYFIHRRRCFSFGASFGFWCVRSFLTRFRFRFRHPWHLEKELTGYSGYSINGISVIRNTTGCLRVYRGLTVVWWEAELNFHIDRLFHPDQFPNEISPDFRCWRPDSINGMKFEKRKALIGERERC